MNWQSLIALSQTDRSRWVRLSLVGLMILAVIAALPASALADGGSSGAMDMSGMQGDAQAMNGSPAGAAGPSGQTVIRIQNFSFGSPLTVAAGTTVQWVNGDTVAHTVTADSGAFDSGPLAPGASFQFTFNQAGTFAYYCRFHGGPGGQGMASQITVTAAASGQGGQPTQPNPQPSPSQPAQPNPPAEPNQGPGNNNYGQGSGGNGYGMNMPGYGGSYGSQSQGYNNNYYCPGTAYGGQGYGAYAPGYGYGGYGGSKYNPYGKGTSGYGYGYSSKGSTGYGKGAYSAPKTAPYYGNMRAPRYYGSYGRSMGGW